MPLALVLAGCGDSVTAPQQVDTPVQVGSPALTIVGDTVPRDTTSRTGGTMGSGN
ncbi:MAG TPA: hypothetical protein VEY93_14045 [Longimicrobium sp.]|nr:hypothetical protein [Longimicrobium sp.]